MSLENACSYFRYSMFFGLLAGLISLGALFFILLAQDEQAMDSNRELVRALHLTDVCLTTEARHLRHLSTPELMAPFQDIPGYLDHNPSSGFLFPNNLVRDRSILR
jgi:hypothetical protein